VSSDWRSDGTPLRLGISACLLGRGVRYDGGHKRDSFLADVLGPHVEWVPVCPEVELGMGIPRPAIRLESREGEIRLIEPRSGRDHTAVMQAFAARRAAQLEKLDLCGYVLKKDSPSCGLERVRLWQPGSGRPPARQGQGLFAAALQGRMPALPLEEEGRLRDARLRENFVERVFSYRRLRALLRGRWTLGDLVEFHTAHKMLLLAHCETRYRQLGRLVAQARELPRPELRARYAELFMSALTRPATTRRHTNVLEHMLGHLRGRLDPGSRTELADLIADYRRALIPLVVPVTLLRHHVRVLGIAYLADQVYLDPHPRELLLRNHV
jgi:uncharacterized protein YbgA (DUF1722 family)/uncharacterized protein YbbK (DUF523 family)